MQRERREHSVRCTIRVNASAVSDSCTEHVHVSVVFVKLFRCSLPTKAAVD